MHEEDAWRMNRDSLATTIVNRLLTDLTGRHGFRQEWDLVDPDVKHELRLTWDKIVKNTLDEAHEC